MNFLHAVLIAIIAVAFFTTSVMAQPTSQELVLQAGAGIAGYVIGGVTSAIVSLGLASSYSAEHCLDLPESDPDSSGSNIDALEECMLQFGFEGIKQLNANAAAGSAIGTLVGVTLAAEAQGHDGNFLTSAIAAYAGYVISRHVTSMSMRAVAIAEHEGLLSDEELRSKAVHSSIVMSVSPIIAVAFTMMGYYLI